MGLRDSLMGKAKSPEKAGSGAAGTPEKVSEEGGSSGGNGKAPEGSAAEDTEVGPLVWRARAERCRCLTTSLRTSSSRSCPS